MYIYICIHHANLGCHKLIQTKLLMQSDTADIYSSDCGFPAYVTHTHTMRLPIKLSITCGMKQNAWNFSTPCLWYEPLHIFTYGPSTSHD